MKNSKHYLHLPFFLSVCLKFLCNVSKYYTELERSYEKIVALVHHPILSIVSLTKVFLRWHVGFHYISLETYPTWERNNPAWCTTRIFRFRALHTRPRKTRVSFHICGPRISPKFSHRCLRASKQPSIVRCSPTTRLRRDKSGLAEENLRHRVAIKKLSKLIAAIRFWLQSTRNFLVRFLLPFASLWL